MNSSQQTIPQTLPTKFKKGNSNPTYDIIHAQMSQTQLSKNMKEPGLSWEKLETFDVIDFEKDSIQYESQTEE